MQFNGHRLNLNIFFVHWFQLFIIPDEHCTLRCFNNTIVFFSFSIGNVAILLDIFSFTTDFSKVKLIISQINFKHSRLKVEILQTDPMGKIYLK